MTIAWDYRVVGVKTIYSGDGTSTWVSYYACRDFCLNDVRKPRAQSFSTNTGSRMTEVVTLCGLCPVRPALTMAKAACPVARTAKQAFLVLHFWIRWWNGTFVRSGERTRQKSFTSPDIPHSWEEWIFGYPWPVQVGGSLLSPLTLIF